MRIVIAGLIAAILVVPSTAGAWGLEVHQFIVSRAIDILPEPIRPFFEANRAFIVERAIDPDLWRNAGFTEEPPNHFLDMDAYGPYPFKDLPREYDEAVKKHGVDKLKQNGLVPWRTHEIAGRLIRGFEALHKNGQYARSDIRFFSAIIGHYVADAHVPLHSVLNYNGQLTGQTGIHYRWESDLFLRYQNKLVLKPGPFAAFRMSAITFSRRCSRARSSFLRCWPPTKRRLATATSTTISTLKHCSPEHVLFSRSV